ncbi:MAG: helix-turn-helix transcriptional regulator [Treponema sp.]|nr:helix-turn-helix transcriptional regulator [Treponema sp.]
MDINSFPVPDIYNFPPVIPNDVGQLKLLRQECKDKIIYYDWDLSFKNDTFASRPDNFGKDEIQVIFNLNQPIEWKIEEYRQTKTEYVKMLPGEVCVFRNNDYHTSMNYNAATKFQFKSLQMETAYFENLLSRYFPPEKIEICKELFLTHVTKTQITKDMYRVLSEIDSAEKYREFAGVFLEAKMIELIALVLYGISYNEARLTPRNMAEGEALNTEKEKFSASKADIKKVESLRQRIQFNPADSYRASSLARELSMSESKLTRLFTSLYGIPLHRYVQNQRLERAANLIADGGFNISEVAIKSGYTNMSHFSKEFQKKYGITPKKFGKQTPL